MSIRVPFILRFLELDILMTMAYQVVVIGLSKSKVQLVSQAPKISALLTTALFDLMALVYSLEAIIATLASQGTSFILLVNQRWQHGAIRPRT